MRYKLLVVLLLFSGMILAQDKPMNAAEIAQFRKEVNAASSTIKTLSTDFIQYKHMEFLSKDVETSGKMVFMEPNRLAWGYEKPYQYRIVFSNGKIFINDAGKKSKMDANASKTFAKINKLIVGSVSGNLFDEKEFNIQYFKNAQYNVARFTPKDAGLKKYIKEVELSFHKTQGTVEQVRLLESESDYTKIVFKNKKMNAAVSDSDFSY